MKIIVITRLTRFRASQRYGVTGGVLKFFSRCINPLRGRPIGGGGVHRNGIKKSTDLFNVMFIVQVRTLIQVFFYRAILVIIQTEYLESPHKIQV